MGVTPVLPGELRAQATDDRRDGSPNQVATIVAPVEVDNAKVQWATDPPADATASVVDVVFIGGLPPRLIDEASR
jgi:hypothetical protein